jgi:hypothetical protein
MILASVSALEKLSFDKQVEDGEVKELVKKWSEALDQKDILELLSLSVRLGEDGAGAQKLFRNLAYELSMAQPVKSQLMGVYRAGKWVAAGFAHGDGEQKVFSLMLVIPTDNGLKFLLEIDLISEDNRTRKFLNNVSFQRLKTYVSEAELEELEGLFEEFEKAVR